MVTYKSMCVYLLISLVTILPSKSQLSAEEKDASEYLLLHEYFENGQLEQVVTRRNFDYLYAKTFLLLRTFDVFQDIRYAVRAARLCEQLITLCPNDQKADVYLMSAYANLKSNRWGRAYKYARMSHETKRNDKARALEAWALLNMSTGVVHETRLIEGSPIRTEFRPKDYPGDGKITESERAKWATQSVAIIHKLLSRKTPPSSPLIYYVGGCAKRAGLKVNMNIVDMFREYLSKSRHVRSNTVRRKFVTDVINRNTNSAKPNETIEDKYYSSYEHCQANRFDTLKAVYIRIIDIAGNALRKCTFGTKSITIYHDPAASIRKSDFEHEMAKFGYKVKCCSHSKKGNIHKLLFEKTNIASLDISEENRIFINEISTVGPVGKVNTDVYHNIAKDSGLTHCETSVGKINTCRLFDLTPCTIICKGGIEHFFNYCKILQIKTKLRILTLHVTKNEKLNVQGKIEAARVSSLVHKQGLLNKSAVGIKCANSPNMFLELVS